MTKKILRCLAPVLAVLLLAGCLPADDTPSTIFTRPGYWTDDILQTSSTYPTGTSGGGFEIPTAPSTQSKPTTKPTVTTKPSTKPTTKPSTLPPRPPQTTQGQVSLLSCSQYGRYSGLYIEDGKDEYITNVAALYVTNTSNEYLEYANVICDINGQEATFVVTGLKPGASSWVLERNKLTIDVANVDDMIMTLKGDQTSYVEDTTNETAELRITPQSGYLTAYNNTGKDLKNVYVYYKKQLNGAEGYQDGIYLGGITYRVLLGDIANGTSSQATAGHCTPTGCEIVRITWE